MPQPGLQSTKCPNYGIRNSLEEIIGRAIRLDFGFPGRVEQSTGVNSARARSAVAMSKHHTARSQIGQIDAGCTNDPNSCTRTRASGCSKTIEGCRTGETIDIAGTRAEYGLSRAATSCSSESG